MLWDFFLNKREYLDMSGNRVGLVGTEVNCTRKHILLALFGFILLFIFSFLNNDIYKYVLGFNKFGVTSMNIITWNTVIKIKLIKISFYNLI